MSMGMCHSALHLLRPQLKLAARARKLLLHAQLRLDALLDLAFGLLAVNASLGTQTRIDRRADLCNGHMCKDEHVHIHVHRHA